MTDNQRINLMANLWPKACRAQGWNSGDRAKRMEVLSAAVGRPLASASQLNNTTDYDAVKRHLGFLADNLAATVETIKPEQGRARRLRATIREQLRCLNVYLTNDAERLLTSSPTKADKYLAEIIRDKFKHASRAQPLTLDDLTDESDIGTTRAGVTYPKPSQLEQVMMALARAIQAKRKAAGDTIHDMKLKAGVYCDCKACCRVRAVVVHVQHGTNPLPPGAVANPQPEEMPDPENEPF